MVFYTGTLTYGRTWVPGGGPSWCVTCKSESEAEATRWRHCRAAEGGGKGKSKPGRLYYRGMAVHLALTGRLAQRSSRRADNSECSAISAEFGLVGGNQGEVHEINSCRSCSPGCRQSGGGYRGVAGSASVASVVVPTA